LLILDDLGLKSYTLEESRDILEIAENRYNKASTILVGQIAHTKWYDLFPDPTIADAIMGRVIHNSYILALDSKKSMREVMAEKTMFPPAQNVNKLMVLPVQRMMDIMSISKL
jgi:DNA replication protein DnaC